MKVDSDEINANQNIEMLFHIHMTWSKLVKSDSKKCCRQCGKIKFSSCWLEFKLAQAPWRLLWQYLGKMKM